MEKKRKVFCLSQLRHSKVRKILMILFLIMAFGVQLHATVVAQGKRMVIDEESIDLADLIWKIEEETDCEFIFNYKDLQNFTKLKVKTEGEIEEVLTELLKDKGLDYKLKGNVYIISKAEKKPKPKSKSNASDQEEKKTIKGKVVDEKGEPLPGVTVQLKGTYIGTSTNIDGFFRLTSSQATGVLVFSFVGKASKYVNFKYGDKIVVQLEDDASNLNEVVVLAYDERDEKEVISSVSTVTAKDMKDVPVDNFLELLQGRMTGVNVTHASGVPGGAGTKINIRGYNSLMLDGRGEESDGSPLYVVDGVPMTSFVSPVTGTNVISDLNPENIESVTVLKDASSAALYGSRAANGVIMIKTKAGKAGYNVFSVNLSQSFTYNPEYPKMIGGALERRWTIMKNINMHRPGYDWRTRDYAYYASYLDAMRGNIDGAEYDAYWDNGREHNNGGGMVHDSINPYYNNSTNWFKQRYRTGKVTNANLQASGGTENFKYLVGLGIYNNKGILVNSSFKRVDGLVNLTAKPRRNLDIYSRTIIAYTDRSLNTSGSSFGLNKGHTDYISADPLRASTLLRAGGAGAEDQIKYLRGSINKADAYRINTTIGLKYSFLKHFSWKNTFSWDLQQDHSNQFQPSYLHSEKKSKTAGTVTRNQQLQFESILKFDKSFNDTHNLGVMLGYSLNRNTYNLVYGEGLEGPSDDVHYRWYGWVPYDKDKGSIQVNFNSDFSEKMMVGLFTRLNYNYKQKYLLNATLRRDGSSTFGIDSRWGYFPSIGAGWNFSDENFMAWAHWLDAGKIRASWGRTGRPLKQPYLAHGAVSPSLKTFNGNGTISPASINYKLEWEKSDQYDIGLDLTFLNRRIITKFDYYYKYTFDILNRILLPGNTSGVDKMWANCMALSNRGLEFSIDAVILRNSALKWRSRFNISRNWNRLEKTYDGRDFANHVLGKSTNRIGVYIDEGFYAKDEDLPFTYDLEGRKKVISHVYGRNAPASYAFRKIKDINGDGKIDPINDRVYLESSLPAAFGGFSNEFKYKNFSLSFLMNFTLGQHMIDGISYQSMGKYPYILNPNNFTTYDQVGPSADLPPLGDYESSTYNYEQFLSSRIENVSYLKLSTLTFGYELSRELCNKLKIKQLRFFLTGGNLFRIDNFSGPGDPEQVDISKGLVDKVYPLSRNITVGVTAKF